MVRCATLKDFDAVYELMCILEDTVFDRENFVEVFREWISEDNRYCFVFDENSKIKGSVSLRIESQLHHCGKIGEIVDFVVSPECRSQGVGETLFKKCLEISKDKDCIQLELSSNMIRKRAHNFYERKGMEKTHYKLTMGL